MNNIIKLIFEQGLSEQFRGMTIGIAAIVTTIFSIWYGTKLKISKKKIILFLLIAYPIDYLLLEISMLITQYAMRNHLFGIQTVVNSQSKTFVVLPLVAFLAAKIIKVMPKVIADILAVANLLNYAICSLGCLFTGCCIGYPSSRGIYAPTTEKNAFPIQVVNAAIMVSITIYLVYRSKKLGYEADGKQFPWMFILFGSTRFVTEFFMDNEKVFLGCSVVALHALFMLSVGIVILVVTCRRTNKRLKEEAVL